MPNTLVHFGIQGLSNRLISDRIDFKWVFLGCIIPDLPWIFRRAAISLAPSIDLYDLRLYTLVQASLLFCVLLSMVFALLSEKPRLVFGILSINSLVHLLLDALEIKWGNGVLLFAPINWELLSFGLVWPDSILVAVLSLPGLLLCIWILARPVLTPIRLKFHSKWRLLAVAFLVALYTVGPLAFLNGPYSTDSNSIATLQQRESRVGREIRLDRENYEKRPDGDVAITFTGEPLRIIGEVRAQRSLQVSLIGEFVDFNTIRIHHLHEFHSPWRDLANYFGLGLFALIWIASLIRERRIRQ